MNSDMERSTPLSLSRSPAAHWAATDISRKQRKGKLRKRAFHFHNANLFKLMAANLTSPGL